MKPSAYPLDLVRLYEDGEADGRPLAIVSKGHHTASAFKRALLADDERAAAKLDVHHVWRRAVPAEGRTTWVHAQPFARGAFPVTLVEVA